MVDGRQQRQQSDIALMQYPVSRTIGGAVGIGVVAGRIPRRPPCVDFGFRIGKRERQLSVPDQCQQGFQPLFQSVGILPRNGGGCRQRQPPAFPASGRPPASPAAPGSMGRPDVQPPDRQTRTPPLPGESSLLLPRDPPPDGRSQRRSDTELFADPEAGTPDGGSAVPAEIVPYADTQTRENLLCPKNSS